MLLSAASEVMETYGILIILGKIYRQMNTSENGDEWIRRHEKISG
jgi:hypothetical protein